MYGKLIRTDIFKYCDSIKGVCNGIANFNHIPRFFVLPVVKDFSRHKRIIRKCRNLISNAKINKILRLFANYVSIFIFYYKGYTNLTFKECIQRQIFTYRRFFCVLYTLSVFFSKPSFEGCSRFDRIRRKYDGRSCGSGHLFILGTINHKGNGKDILLIVCFHCQVFRNNRTYCKLICRSGIYPLTYFVSLGRNIREVINSKPIVNAGRPGLFSSVFLYKCNRVNNLVLCHNSFKRLVHNCIRCYFCRSAGNDPLCIITRHFRNSRKLITNRRSFNNLNRLFLKLLLCRRVERYRN